MLKPVAQVLKSHGAEGELVIGFRAEAPEDMNVNEPVFIYFDGLPVPFFIESFSRKGTDRARVRLTGMRNLKDAEEAAGQLVYVERPDTEETEEDFTGWTVANQYGLKIGTIAGHENIPGNPCINVYTEEDKAEVMLPFHEDLILSADEKSKTLVMTVPEGLI